MDDWLAPFLFKLVAVDLSEQYLAIGTVAEVGPEHLVLVDCDLHDHREANSTKDVYLIETRHIGVRVNRRRVTLPRRNVVAVALLEDIAS